MTPRIVWNRVYGDFLMPSRLDSYRRLIESALRADYEVTSIERFWQLTTNSAIDPAQRYLILRHDVDTDPRTAGAMWQIDQALGANGSYFFRLSTLNVGLMQIISDAGGQASYHYEELAALAKRRHLRDPEDVIRAIPEAQDCFRRNLERLRALSGLPMRVVAAHGDFVNRKLGISNETILADPHFRRETGVELETSDDAFMCNVSTRHCDTHHPQYWTSPGDPLGAIRRGEPVVYLLVHPRHWRVTRGENARDDIQRLREEILYGFARSSTRGRA